MLAAWATGAPAALSEATELIPPLAMLKPDHPRLLLRPNATPTAISLQDLRSGPRDDSWRTLLGQLRSEKSASAQAMAWLLTADATAAERALAIMRDYRRPADPDTFHVYFTLTQFALAYDWLHGWDGFTANARSELRSKMRPLAERGLAFADDHMFHNYIWMSAGGVALWALATGGEDEASDRLFDRVRQRFNTGLFPAWKYLDGLPSEPMGYWALYVFSPGALTLLGAQSAFETDLLRRIASAEGDWLGRHFENLIHSTLPNMRYLPWGDLQGGPNGGVTHDMAGIVDALTWATRSAHGAWFSRWLAAKRGLARFRADTAIYYFLYARHLEAAPAEPPLSFFAGNERSAHFIARSGWTDADTVVALGATDHFGDHHHFDQGSFTIYRRGLLAVDPPVYRKVAGPQQPTAVHNTLLFAGQGQRPVRGQWFKTIADFQKNLQAGRRLETGEFLWHKDEGVWAGAACQFAQAYAPTQVRSCVRQLLFVRPGTVVVVDQLTGPPGRPLPEVQWLLQLPSPPAIAPDAFWSTNNGSWLRCRPLLPGPAARAFEPTSVGTHRATLTYAGASTLRLVHLLEVGDGHSPAAPVAASASHTSRGEIEVALGTNRFVFSKEAPFPIR